MIGENIIRKPLKRELLGLLLWLIIPFASICFAPPLLKNPTSASAKTRRLTFQQGVDSYSGAVDSEIWALAPSTILESNPQASSDADNDGGESQVLIRFDHLIGQERYQVPFDCNIVSARLYVSAFDQGTTVNLHRMLVPFSKTVTWNSMVDGVSADGFEASRHKDSFTFGKIAANSSTVVFDVTDTVQYWVHGHSNYGWVFLNTGGNGWDFYASEFDDVKQRPKLEIVYEVPSTVGRLAATSSEGGSDVP